ncbi:MAG: winged helix-turn-helix transcriptional regulator [Anaerolineae bacterium]
MDEHETAGEAICPIEQVAQLIGSKWTLLIIRDLMDGCRRFGQLQKSIGAISPRTLSERLSMLEKRGLVRRQAYPEIPPRVEYSLTEKGRALMPLLRAVREYGEKWLVRPL